MSCGSLFNLKTFDRSDEEIWPDQQKDNDTEKDNDKNNHKDIYRKPWKTEGSTIEKVAPSTRV